MQDVLDVNCRPYDPRFPQVCRDETSKQLLGEVRPPARWISRPEQPINNTAPTQRKARVPARA